MRNLNKEPIQIEFYSGGVKSVSVVVSSVSGVHVDNSLQLVRVLKVDSKMLNDNHYICIEENETNFTNLELGSVICDKWVVPICQEMGIDTQREFTDLNTLVRNLILYDKE